MDNNNTFSISFLKFDAVPIPKFQNRISNQFIKYGEDNLFPYLLIDFANESAKHNSILETKVTYILGGGLQSENEADTGAMDFIKRYTNLAEQVIRDLEMFNGFYIECLPTVGGGWQFSHMPFETIRKNFDETIYYYRRDWRYFSGRSVDKKEYHRFDPSVREVSIIEYKGYRAGQSTYALPVYVAALNYIKADCEVAKHTLGNATGGFTGSKMISFFNGEPPKEKKKEIETGISEKFTGSGGKKLMITFNNESTKKPEVEDLGASDLTKEDFTAVDDMISLNIYAGHQVTSPSLFGVPAKNHSLGGNAGSELRMNYETFCNTYVNKRIDIVEKLLNKLAKLRGVQSGIKMVRVEPIGLQLSEDTLLKLAPKSYLIEKLGIDLTKYTDAPIDIAVPQPGKMPMEDSSATPAVNEHLKNLTAKQNQQVLRIIRQYKKGTIEIETATILLKNGYGLSDEDITAMLGTPTVMFADMEDEEDFACTVFESHGEPESNFISFDTMPVMFADVDVDINAKVARVLEKNPKATAATISKELSISKELADQIINSIDAGGGRVLTKLPKMEVRYGYQLRAGVQGPPIIETTRPFCRRILTAGKLYTGRDIQNMSQILGYDVMRRSGGFWNRGGKKGTDIQCRHNFVSKIVIKK